MRGIVLLLVLSAGGMVMADSARDYRNAFMQTCASERDDYRICACTFDRWIEGMDNPEAPGAVIAARLVSQGEQARPSGYEAQQAAPYISDLGGVGNQCAQAAYADYTRNPPEQPSQEEIPANAQNEQEEKQSGGGLFGGLLGVAKGVGKKAVEDSGFGQFIPFGKKGAAHDDDTPLTERPVPEYEPLFTNYCMVSYEDDDLCGCRWNALTGVLAGVDTPQTRTVAYMASHDPGDLPLPEDAPVDREKAYKTFSRYTERAGACDS